ncbi:MAG TPA: hypothetical protein VGH15_09765 [Caulobacteraceae bacterium]
MSALLAMAAPSLAAPSPAEMNATIEAAASQAPRGAYPRAFSGEQSYWTLIGVDGGAASGLISEDGAIELGKGGPSIEPFVVDRGRLVTWADAKISQSLDGGYLPIPVVTWRRPGWMLRVTTFADGEAAHPRLAARYELRNLTGRRRNLVLALAARPFQVNGPEQFLNSPGGVSPIHDLAWNGAALTIDGRRAVTVTQRARFLPNPVNADALPDALRSTRSAASVHDAGGMASGVLIWRLTLPANGAAAVDWIAPLTDGPPPRLPFSFEREREAVANGWRRRLGRVAIEVPSAGRAVADTLKTSLAYMLISRNGPELRPGTRSYDRSWIRDGTMISGALLRLGETRAAADYLRWYAPHQFADGKAPCCIDARGADPTQENDSDGEFIHLVADVYRYGGDGALLRALWPRVEAAADYMDRLRQAEAVAHGGAGAATRGLLPPSISHEGYSAKPAYSYWDDFWALRGYEDALFIARTLGERAATARLTASLGLFRRDLYASIPASARAHGVDYIPGAADLGDFDPTSTTIALSPGGGMATLPRSLLDETFERYWQEFVERRDGKRTWDAYTPYELRTIGSFFRLGWRERAGELLAWFMKGRRPLAWNGWAEVVGRDARKPRFLGDEPHAWVASDYVRSVLDMFAYERPSDKSLVLGAGVPRDWFAGEGVGVRDLRTPYGILTWSAARRGGGFTLRLGGDARPPGGFVFAWPFRGPPGPTLFNGRAVAWRDGVVRLTGGGVLVVKAAHQAPPARG